MSNQMVETKRVLPDALKRGYDEVRKLNREETLQAFLDTLADAYEIVRRRSQYVFHWREMGWPMAVLQERYNRHIEIYDMVGDGRLLLELFDPPIEPDLIAAAMRLTINDQRLIAKNEPVKVVVGFGTDGSPFAPEIPLREVKKEHYALIFKGGRINDVAEQVVTIRSRDKRKRQKQVGKITRVAGGLEFSIGNARAFFSDAQVEAEMSKASPRRRASA